MAKDKEKLRNGQRNYHDDIFENEINNLINITQSHYEA
jgi:leucyl-tRNA synthetase